MEELKYVLFGVGLLAFFATVYLAVANPELVDSPAGEPKPEVDQHPLRKWDRVITFVMWGSWGLVGLLTFFDEAGLLDFLD